MLFLFPPLPSWLDRPASGAARVFVCRDWLDVVQVVLEWHCGVAAQCCSVSEVPVAVALRHDYSGVSFVAVVQRFCLMIHVLDCVAF